MPLSRHQKRGGDSSRSAMLFGRIVIFIVEPLVCDFLVCGLAGAKFLPTALYNGKKWDMHVPPD